MSRTTYISAAEAARTADVDRRTIVNWCQEKRFSASMVGGVWIINERSFLDFLWRRLTCK